MGADREVRINYKLEGTGSTQAATRKMSSSFNILSRSINRAWKSIMTFRTFFVLYLGRAAFSSAKKHLIDYNKQMEEFRFGIAMSVNQMTDWKRSFGGVSSAADRWQLSMKAGVISMKMLRKIAAEGIGGLDDYVEGFSVLSSSVLSAGGNLSQVMDITRKMVPIAKSMGRPAMVAAMDIRQLLAGRSNLREITLPVFHPKAKEIAGLAKEGKRTEALEMIIAVLTKAESGVVAFGKTYSAQIDTFIDNWKIFAGEVGKPLFNRLTQWLTKFNEGWSVTNMKLRETGSLLGTRLVSWFDNAASNASKFVAQLKQVAIILGDIAKLAVASNVVGMGVGVGQFIGGEGGRKSIGRRKGLAGRFARGMFPGHGGATAEKLKDVGAFRSMAGKTVGSLMMLGGVLAVTDWRIKELSKGTGWMSDTAKEAKVALGALASIMNTIGDAAVVMMGSIAALGKFMGQMAAKIFTMARKPPPHVTGDITDRDAIKKSGMDARKLQKDVFGPWAKERKEKLEELLEPYGGVQHRQGAFVIPAGLPKNVYDQVRAYSDVTGKSKVRFHDVANEMMKKAGVSKKRIEASMLLTAATNASVRKEVDAESVVSPGALRKIFGAHWRGKLEEGGIEGLRKSSKSILGSQSGDVGLTGAFLSGNQSQGLDIARFANIVASGFVKQGLGDDILKTYGALVEKEAVGQQIAIDKARDKAGMAALAKYWGPDLKPPDVNLSGGHTWNIQQDFRDVDPDRVAIQFLDHIGGVAATGVQSKLIPLSLISR